MMNARHTIPRISVAERGITITWMSWAIGHTTVGGTVLLIQSDAKREGGKSLMTFEEIKLLSAGIILGFVLGSIFAFILIGILSANRIEEEVEENGD